MNSKKKILRDLCSMLFFAVIAVLFYFVFIPQQVTIASWNAGSSTFNGTTFPNLVTGAIFIASVIGIIKNLILLARLPKDAGQAEKAEKAKETIHSKLSEFLPFLMTLVIIGYYFLFVHAGYIIATLIMAPVLLLLLRCKKWTYYMYVYAFALVIYLIFVYILKVQLP